MHRIHKYITFNGDYSALKGMGYTFQKLFADNYMQWCKGDVRVWKKGAEVTVGRLCNYEGAFFDLVLDYMAREEPLPFNDRNTLRYYTNNDPQNPKVYMGEQADIDYRACFLAEKAYMDLLDDKFPMPTDDLSMLPHNWFDKQKEKGAEIGIVEPPHRSSCYIDKDTLDILFELLDRGWIGLGEFNVKL
jgi:hypothetical protein